LPLARILWFERDEFDQLNPIRRPVREIKLTEGRLPA